MKNNNSVRDVIMQNIVTSKEAQIILGISRARLSQLASTKKLNPIKRNLYLLSDVLARKDEQEDLRAKYYRPKREK